MRVVGMALFNIGCFLSAALLTDAERCKQPSQDAPEADAGAEE